MSIKSASDMAESPHTSLEVAADEGGIDHPTRSPSASASAVEVLPFESIHPSHTLHLGDHFVHPSDHHSTISTGSLVRGNVNIRFDRGHDTASIERVMHYLSETNIDGTVNITVSATGLKDPLGDEAVSHSDSHLLRS